MARILLITRVVSPFQLELGEALRELGHDAHVLFSNGDIGTRPKHWAVGLPDWSHAIDIESNPLRLIATFEQLAPEVVVYGGYRGLPIPLAKRLARKSGAKFGFWLERPFPGPAYKTVVRDFFIERALRGADFLLCIGPTALTQYQALIPDRGRLHTLPYGQDLRGNLAWPREYHRDGVTFLFSGKYCHRNNVWEMLSAFRAVRLRHGEKARLLLSGYAGMDREIRASIDSDPVLEPAVRHDVDFATWDDRLRPFKQADVLLVPGVHAGWGLIVPEAMSLGMPVVAGRGIESAAMLVREGVDGFLVGASYLQIADALERFVANPSLLEQMGRAARSRAAVCDARTVAQRLIELVISPERAAGASATRESVPYGDPSAQAMPSPSRPG